MKIRVFLTAVLLVIGFHASANTVNFSVRTLAYIDFGSNDVDFDSDTNNIQVITADGFFSGLVPFTDLGTINDFNYSPLPTGTPSTSLVWTAGEYSFTLDTIDQSSIQEVTSGGFQSLSLSATGTANRIGSTGPIEGLWTISLDSSNSGDSFIFSTSTTVVPVPAAAWLFGTGLLGLAGVSRRKRTT